MSLQTVWTSCVSPAYCAEIAEQLIVPPEESNGPRPEMPDLRLPLSERTSALPFGPTAAEPGDRILSLLPLGTFTALCFTPFSPSAKGRSARKPYPTRNIVTDRVKIAPLEGAIDLKLLCTHLK